MGVEKWIGQAAGGVAGLASIGIGIADRVKGNREYNKAQSFFEQNKYDIPDSATAALNVAQQNAASMRLPGQDLAEQRIGQNTAGGVEQARRIGRNSSDVLGMLGNLYASQNNAELGLAQQGAAGYMSNQRNFQSALNTYASLEDKKWQYNVLYPYQQMLGRASAFGDRGTQEISGGVNAIAQTGASYVQSKAQENMYNNWWGNQFGSNPTGKPVMDDPYDPFGDPAKTQAYKG